MRLILIRHAATEANRHRYIGREDLPLSAEGERQAELLAARMAREQLDTIYSSPLVRAVRTAQPIARCQGVDVRIRNALMEIDFGELQGAIKGERLFSLKRMYLANPMPGGESLTDVWHRLHNVRAELTADLEMGRNVAVVGHYWSNRILLAQLRQLPLERSLAELVYKPANASALALDFTKIGSLVNLRSSDWLID